MTKANTLRVAGWQDRKGLPSFLMTSLAVPLTLGQAHIGINCCITLRVHLITFILYNGNKAELSQAMKVPKSHHSYILL